MGYKESMYLGREAMKPPPDIIYIRSVDLRPLYTKFNGRYHLVVRVLRPVTPDRIEEYRGYELRDGDFLEIAALKRLIKIEIGQDTELTDEPRLAKLGYPFA